MPLAVAAALWFGVFGLSHSDLSRLFNYQDNAMEGAASFGALLATAIVVWLLTARMKKGRALAAHQARQRAYESVRTLTSPTCSRTDGTSVGYYAGADGTQTFVLFSKAFGQAFIQSNRATPASVDGAPPTS